MNKKKSARKKTTAGQKRLAVAKKDFDRIREEIKPFVKRRKFREYSTAGDWQQTSTLQQDGDT